MVGKRKIFFNFYLCLLFLTNISFVSSIIEIPLYPLKVPGDFKYRDIIKKYDNSYPENDSLSYYEIIDTEINPELIFQAKIKIGSNSQPFNLLLDTGSYAIWVARYGCYGANNISNFFEPDSSITGVKINETFWFLYGSGATKGYYYLENIEYIPATIANMKIGVADSAFYQLPGCDGIMGLARLYNDERESIITMLYQSGLTDSRAFSIKFEGKFDGGEHGSMFLGIHEDFSKNETLSVPLTNGTVLNQWNINITSFGLKNNKYTVRSSEKPTPVAFDTGSNIFYLPLQYFTDIKDELGKFDCSIEDEGNRMRFKCDKNGNYPDFQFIINGYVFTIPKEHAFFTRASDKDHFYSKAIFFDVPMHIVGSAFFHHFHTLFDMDAKDLKFYPIHKDLLEKDGESNGSNKSNALGISFIVIGSIALIAGVIIIVYFVFIKKKKKESVKKLNAEDIDLISDEGLIKEGKGEDNKNE